MQMDIEGQTEQPGVNPKVIKAKTLKVNSEQTAVIPLKQIIKDQYNQLTLTCKGNYAICWIRIPPASPALRPTPR